MEQNEKYGIELTAETSYFKRSMQELGKYVKAFGQGMKESFVEQTKKIGQNFKDSFKNIRKTKDDLEDTDEELEDINETSQRTGKSLSTLFDKSIGKIKRFTYYLLGARSVFSLFMKYRATYYAFNEEMQYQSELSQNAIALSLAPAFEFLGNIITYASIGLAKFIELLTGVNVLSKVTTKGIRDYNKSLKETQTLVTGIDEITNLTNPQNLGLASQYQALAEFQKKVAEVEEFFKNNKWITDLAEGLKTIWNYLSEKLIPKIGEFIDKIGGAKGALILLGGVAVMGAIAKLIGVAGVGATAGTGLAGIAALLTFIAGVHVITLVLEGKEEFEQLNKDRQEVASNYSKSYTETINHVKSLIEKSKSLNKNSKDYKDTINDINAGWLIIARAIQSGDTEILNNITDAEDLAKILDSITDTNSYTKSFDVSKSIGLDQANDMSKSFWQKWAGWFTNQDKLDEERKRKYLNEFDAYEKEIDDVAEGLEGLNDIEIDDKSANVKYNVTADTSKASSSLTTLFNKFNIGNTFKAVSDKILSNTTAGKVAKGIGEIIGKIFTPYATGLDYVPYDDYPALLHKGEAVVPAKYNPTIHSQGNEYTNSLLETLIYKVEDLSSRPNVFEIDGKQFAQATYNLYDNERKSQGYVEGVIR